MNRIIRKAREVDELPDKLYRNIPDSYPCLAVGIWIHQANGRDGYEYAFVPVTQTEDGFLIDEDDL